MARSMRRRTFWLARPIDYQTVAPGSSRIVLANTTEVHATSEDPTVIRIVGRIWCGFERNTEFKESMRTIFHLGIQCVHEDVTIQDPKLESEDENWMWQGLCMT